MIAQRVLSIALAFVLVFTGSLSAFAKGGMSDGGGPPSGGQHATRPWIIMTVHVPATSDCEGDQRVLARANHAILGFVGKYVGYEFIREFKIVSVTGVQCNDTRAEIKYALYLAYDAYDATIQNFISLSKAELLSSMPNGASLSFTTRATAPISAVNR